MPVCILYKCCLWVVCTNVQCRLVSGLFSLLFMTFWCWGIFSMYTVSSNLFCPCPRRLGVWSTTKYWGCKRHQGHPPPIPVCLPASEKEDESGEMVVFIASDIPFNYSFHQCAWFTCSNQHLVLWWSCDVAEPTASLFSNLVSHWHCTCLLPYIIISSCMSLITLRTCCFCCLSFSFLIDYVISSLTLIA